MSEESENSIGPIKLMIARHLMEPTPDCGIIYYIACPETQRIKIGYSKYHPHRRLKALQTGSPTQLLLMAQHPGTPEDERDIHYSFSAHRLHGEWFEANEFLFEHMAYVCWLVAGLAKHSKQPAPEWAEIGLSAVEEFWGERPPLDLFEPAQ